MFGASLGHDGSNHQTSVCCEKLADLIKDSVKATILSELFLSLIHI